MALFTFVLLFVVMTAIYKITTAGMRVMKTIHHRYQRQIRTQSSGLPSSKEFLSLPMELVAEILSYLEWDDILHARQTCRCFQEASRSRSVWLLQLKHYIALQPRLLWPEKPLDMYSSRELERLILQSKSSQIGWAMNRLSERIPSQRHFFFSDQLPLNFTYPCVYLIEGGRWLLVGTVSGSVQYYDLNAVTISASTLIPSLINGRVEMWISVDMDPGAESLTFHLGVLTRCRLLHDVYDRGVRWIQVWRVTAEINSSGNVIGLNPERQSWFFEEPEDTICFSFRLRGEFVAYSLFHSHRQVGPLNNGHKIVIVNWTTCNPTVLHCTRKIIPDTKATWLDLLHGDRLLCYTDDRNFRLYDLANAPTTTHPSQHPQHPPYTPTASYSVHASAFSRPYSIDNSTRLTFLTRKGVKGMTISDDSKLESIELLTGSFSGRSISMGYNFAVVFPYDHTIQILQYTWPEDHSYSAVSGHSFAEKEMFIGHPYPLFDISSGRLVVIGGSHDKQYILESSNLS